MANETELAWAAGLFDGEGSTYVRQTKGRFLQVAMAISQKDPEVLNRFRGAVNTGSVTGPHGREQYHWSAFARYKVAWVIQLLWPYLSGIKRAQIVRKLNEAATHRRLQRAATQEWNTAELQELP